MSTPPLVPIPLPIPDRSVGEERFNVEYPLAWNSMITFAQRINILAQWINANIGGQGPVEPAITKLLIEGDSQSQISSGLPASKWTPHYIAANPGLTINVNAQNSRVVKSVAGDTNAMIAQRAADLALAPQLIFAMIGSNDLGSRTVAEFLAHLQEWSTPIRAAGIKVILASPPPYMPQSGNAATFNARLAEYLGIMRANYLTYCDGYVPFGEHPDFYDDATKYVLIGDGSQTGDPVHLSGFDTVALNKGQNLALTIFSAALDSATDPSRAGATAPSGSGWLGGDITVFPNVVVKRRYVVKGLGTGVAAQATISGAGATMRRGNGAFGAAGFTVMNGDCIDFEFIAASANSTLRNYTLTIGGVADTLTVTTTAAGAATADYTHGGMEVDATPGANKTWANKTFGTGQAVIIVSQSGTYPTAVSVGGVACTKRMEQDTAYNAKGFQVWTAPVTAGSKDIVVTGSNNRHVLSYGTLTNAAAAPQTPVGAVGYNQSEPHLVPLSGNITVPAGGVALAILNEYAGATITPIAVAGQVIDEENVMNQDETNGLALAKLTSTGVASFDVAGTGSGSMYFGSYGQGYLVWEAA